MDSAAGLTSGSGPISWSQEIEAPCSAEQAAHGRALRVSRAPQRGSVGGGTHFVEMQVDAADGSVWIMIHCGSRGYGWLPANPFFYEGAELRGIAKNRREESWLRADEPVVPIEAPLVDERVDLAATRTAEWRLLSLPRQTRRHREAAVRAAWRRQARRFHRTLPAGAAASSRTPKRAA